MKPAQSFGCTFPALCTVEATGMVEFLLSFFFNEWCYFFRKNCKILHLWTNGMKMVVPKGLAGLGPLSQTIQCGSDSLGSYWTVRVELKILWSFSTKLIPGNAKKPNKAEWIWLAQRLMLNQWLWNFPLIPFDWRWFGWLIFSHSERLLRSELWHQLNFNDIVMLVWYGLVYLW